ncbi:MAG: hypothetical protein P1U89_12865 [Verrucomicrobiales bacterium]|nr:hypothetical protein [Verrucomicrobiales bacterium]
MSPEKQNPALFRSPFLPILCTLFLAGSPFFGAVGQDQKTETGRFPLGPLIPRPAVSIYVVSDGQGEQARVLLRKTHRSKQVTALARVLDPDETVIRWKYLETVAESVSSSTEPRDEIDLIPEEPAPKPGTVLLEESFDLSRAGVYQIRVSCANEEVQVELDLPESTPYGVCFQNGLARSGAYSTGKAYVYIPPHAEALEWTGGPWLIRDEEGRVLTQSKKGGKGELPIGKTDQVWEIEFPEPKSWELRTAGFPFILCDSAGTARQIRGSVEQLEDGTVVCHKFQRRIAQLLPEILHPDKVGITEDLLVPLKSREEAWLAEPLRNRRLQNSFLAAVPKWLGQQNLDPKSHWSGSLDGWQDKENAKPPGNRWDRMRAIDGLFGGASNHYGPAAEHLALGALHDSPTNPYFGKSELLYRAAAAALRDLMTLAEDGTFYGISDMNPYPGNMGFVVGQKTFPVYGLAAPHLPEEIRQVWTEGLRHLVDRAFTDGLVSARNQSSHYLVAFQAYADGSEDPLYQTLARLYAQRWVAGQHPAGWHMEATGPDASYIGMTHWHEAVYYRMSGDQNVLDSLQRSYRFFNHTVAPEPDGKMLGGFNFGHRVGEGFYNDQWGGAKGIVDDVLPEVGIWSAPEPSPEERVVKEEKARQEIRRFLDKPTHPSNPGLNTPRYLHYTEKANRNAEFPSLEKESFIRDLRGELVAVKRPAYYTYGFTGKPAGRFYIRQKEDFRAPFPNGAEENGGTIDMRKITPFLGGGLSGFWTPEYGHFLLAANWAPTTHHGVIATKADGNRYWSDYHEHTHELNKPDGTLTIKGQIESLPLHYIRRYTFGEDSLGVKLTLTAEKDLKLARLVENLPIARGGWKSRGTVWNAAGVAEGEITSQTFRATDQTGKGVEVSFDRVRSLLLVPNGLRAGGWRLLQIGRVEILFPSTLKAGETIDLEYHIRPILAPEVKE